jgi:hypothetical protein
MTCRDYRKEIDLRPGTPTLPWPVAAILLALGAAGLWFGVVKLNAIPSGHRSEAGAEAAPAGRPAPARPATAHS